MKTTMPILVAALLWSSAPALAGGSHFLVEPFTGVTFNHGFSMENAVGFESGALFAVGGKLKGFPPRFYLYVRASESLFGDDDVVADRGALGTINRAYTRITGGLRVVFPIAGKLRLNVEAGGGTMLSRNSYVESGMSEVSYDEDLTVFETGIGLNYRFFEWLSLGVMYNYSYVTDTRNCDLIAAFIGERQDGRELAWSHLNVTLGLHF